MSRRHRAYGLLVLAILTATTVVLGVETWAVNRAEMVWVASTLSEAGWSASRARLTDLDGRFGAGTDARAGLAILDAVLERSDAEPIPRKAVLGRFPVRAILDRALSEQRFAGALALSRRLEEAGAIGYAEYRAAALLELRRIDEARAVTLPAAPVTGLGRRLGRLLAEPDLERILVRDRRGRLLGTYGEAGFLPERRIEEALVPRRALEQLAGVPATGGARLTIDLELSRKALASLGRYYRGSVVVIDMESGDVLAAVSDERTWKEGGTPAFDQQREPASIAKLITVTAAMRAGVDVDRFLRDMRCSGAVAYDDEIPLYCSAVNGALGGLDRALAVSCNVAFAELGRAVGRAAVVAEYRRYGFDADIAMAAFGRVVSPRGSPRQLGELSIGLEASEITPVHAALQAAAFGNGGWMVEPRLLAALDTYLGYSRSPMPAANRWRVVDEEWLPEIVGAMEAVAAPGGTAARVAPEGFPVALKTGTASHPRHGFHVNYIGFAPLPEPEYAFSVRITHQRTSQRVRRAAYTVTRRFLRSLAGVEGVEGSVTAAGP